MYNKLVLIDNHHKKVICNIPISYKIHKPNFWCSSYGSILQIFASFNKSSPLVKYLNSKPNSSKTLILFSMKTTNCIYINQFKIISASLLSSLNSYSINLEFFKIFNGKIGDFPEVKNIYREIKINNILNDL